MSLFVTLRIITLPEQRIGEAADIAEHLAASILPGIRANWAVPVSPIAVINAGHVVWRIVFASEAEALRASGTAAWRDATALLLEGAQIATVGYRIATPGVRGDGPGIWRALVFRVMPHASSELARQLEEDTLLLPAHVPEIRGWALSRVAFCEGPKNFTHVWEQEYAALEDLTGPYMTTPLHWGIVDAYFDAEYPEYIVDPQLTQVIGTIDASVIAKSI